MMVLKTLASSSTDLSSLVADQSGTRIEPSVFDGLRILDASHDADSCDRRNFGLKI